jgi:hypothetical protein
VTHCKGAALHLVRGKYYPRRVTILMHGIEDCLSTKCFSKEKNVRFITWHRTMNNQISHLFMSTGMLIVSCELSEEEDNEDDEKNTITKNIT